MPSKADDGRTDVGQRLTFVARWMTNETAAASIKRRKREEAGKYQGS